MESEKEFKFDYEYEYKRLLKNLEKYRKEIEDYQNSYSDAANNVEQEAWTHHLLFSSFLTAKYCLAMFDIFTKEFFPRTDPLDHSDRVVLGDAVSKVEEAK